MKKHILLIALLLTCACVIDATAQTREEYSYDDMGRVSRYRVVQGAQAFVVSYEYDKRNNITRTLSEVVSSVDDAALKLSVVVHPNPTSSDVTIEAPALAGSTVNFSIIDQAGRQVLLDNVRADATGVARLTLDTVKHKLVSGTYRVTMTSGTSSTSAGFVVTR